MLPLPWLRLSGSSQRLVVPTSPRAARSLRGRRSTQRPRARPAALSSRLVVPTSTRAARSLRRMRPRQRLQARQQVLTSPRAARQSLRRMLPRQLLLPAEEASRAATGSSLSKARGRLEVPTSLRMPQSLRRRRPRLGRVQEEESRAATGSSLSRARRRLGARRAETPSPGTKNPGTSEAPPPTGTPGSPPGRRAGRRRGARTRRGAKAGAPSSRGVSPSPPHLRPQRRQM
mmetsp:Transcript_80466/g.230972  ORF Transcript_80466/g.230972 Transcript_80466/m.230972 type:complete len:231 (+) Transcript_80466:295-987(+)